VTKNIEEITLQELLNLIKTTTDGTWHLSVAKETMSLYVMSKEDPNTHQNNIRGLVAWHNNDPNKIYILALPMNARVTPFDTKININKTED